MSTSTAPTRKGASTSSDRVFAAGPTSVTLWSRVTA